MKKPIARFIIFLFKIIGFDISPRAGLICMYCYDNKCRLKWTIEQDNVRYEFKR